MKLTQKAERAEGSLGAAPVVILARPQLGENVGLVARAMLNFSLHELRLVAPRFGWPNAKAVAAASGAAVVLNRMRIEATLNPAIADLEHVYATTARPRDLDKPTLTAEEAAREAAAAIASGRRVGLLFGPERTGLTNEEIALADAIVTIPVNPAFPSLNLSQAVLVLAYEWYRQRAAPVPRRQTAAQERPATKGELRALLDHVLRELDATDFFRSPSRRESLVRAIEVMFERRALTVAEVNLLHGIVERLAHGRRTGTKADRRQLTEPGGAPSEADPL
jgi:tRNA/rRNA methyltransferase